MEELLKQAEAGDTDAMYALGRGYQFAKFEERPDYEKAAQLKHIEAMSSLADALTLGRGCKKDSEMAHVWYQEAYEMGRVKNRG